MSPRTVRPAAAEGWNLSLAQLWGQGPKWTLTCGDCRGTFRQRVPLVDNPGLPCPYCGAINVLALTWREE